MDVVGIADDASDDVAAVAVGGVGGVVGVVGCIFIGVGGGREVVRRGGVRLADEEDIAA